jgi:hypothetical protein
MRPKTELMVCISLLLQVKQIRYLALYEINEGNTMTSLTRKVQEIK